MNALNIHYMNHQPKKKSEKTINAKQYTSQLNENINYSRSMFI